MKIKRRYPNCSSGFEVTEHEVTSREDIYQIDWIKEYSMIPGSMGIFYSPASYECYPDVLMHLRKTDSGRVVYFAVGYIFDGKGEDLGLENYLLYVKNNEHIETH